MSEDKKDGQILIVEDGEPIARALKLKLEHEGFLVHIATDGEEAVHLLDEHSFNLVILDLMMPHMDGFEFLQYMKDKNKKIPIFIVSNLSQIADIKKAEEYGAEEFFVKSNTPLAVVVEYVTKRLQKI